MADEQGAPNVGGEGCHPRVAAKSRQGVGGILAYGTKKWLTSPSTTLVSSDMITSPAPPWIDTKRLSGYHYM